ncbi:MAG: arsenosugar biosynthesis radical SAM (seleno)protein ArsS [Candidatus Tectimicrobiota bacterium]
MMPLTTLAPFATRVHQAGEVLRRHSIDTVQINVGKRCNQACLHCHVDAGPQRTEAMTPRIMALALDLARAAKAQTVDITGGAPELHPAFRTLVRQARQEGFQVLDRCNLTVLHEPGQEDLAAFLAQQGVQVIASLPCYLEDNVEQQRGRGVYGKSIEALRQLNALGYGRDGSGLLLHLVYNPIGTHLPPPQVQLEAEYKRELQSRFGIHFNHLYTITNMPIARFAHSLQREGTFDAYMSLLAEAFNPATLVQVMCRNLISIAWDGYLYDCDFNQMLALHAGNGIPLRLGDAPADALVRQIREYAIVVGQHCYGCTAGTGSSCGGALTEA